MVITNTDWMNAICDDPYLRPVAHTGYWISGQQFQNELAPFTDSPWEDDGINLADLMPTAICYNGHDNCAVDSVLDAVDEELNLNRLTVIQGLLWVAGRPMPPRPLHYQRGRLQRELVITERLDTHLVWGDGGIFVKPLPRYLLEPRFWEQHLQCPPSLPCATRLSPLSMDEITYRCGKRRERALGFLFSYTGLVVHESDFLIAKENNLLPQKLEWQAWRRVARDVLRTKDIYSSIHPRFHYGELKLSRLNKIYMFRKSPFKRFLGPLGNPLHASFATLASSTVYLALVLTAMQVGLATTRLRDNTAFQAVSYGFTVFSILGPLIYAVLLLSTYIFAFAWSWRPAEIGITLLPAFAGRVSKYRPTTLEEMSRDLGTETHLMRLVGRERGAANREKHRLGKEHYIQDAHVEQTISEIIDEFLGKQRFSATFELRILSTLYPQALQHFSSWLDLQKLAKETMSEQQENIPTPSLRETLLACGFGVDARDFQGLVTKHNAATDSLRTAAVLVCFQQTEPKSLHINRSQRRVFYANKSRGPLASKTPGSYTGGVNDQNR
ncbi:hypothetical protein HJFPF1_04134 [Paramyrothecium foliicola]|nr:hypothetical protein HJFPF1_04134 [Paramyrothecium foliicola]